jgi:hypothetical protein
MSQTHGRHAQAGNGNDGEQEMRAAVVVGGGPAGTALLIAASRAGLLPGLSAQGLTIIDNGTTLGGGGLHGHAINGDSTAKTFLSAVAPSAGPELAALASHVTAMAIAGRMGSGEGEPVPLKDVAAFMDVLAADLSGRVAAAGGTVLLQTTALQARRRADGAWVTDVAAPGGAVRSLVSRNVVLATGGQQTTDRLLGETLAGRTFASLCHGRLVASGDLIAHGGAEAVIERLRTITAPRIAVLGSSTSAVAACRLLLNRGERLRLGHGSLTLLHRRPLRLFYPSQEEALADGYSDFTQADICPVSGFVYRLGGFRMEARELVARALRVGGRVPDTRLRLQRIVDAADADAASTLAQADLVIHALGYRPRALRVLDEQGQPIRLASDAGAPLVNGRGQIRDAGGQPVPGLFALGLASGFVPSGALGGEPSFSGQANGLWLWQNDVGRMIAEQIDDREAQSQAA